MVPEAVKAASSEWPERAALRWSAVSAEAKFRAIAIIYNRGGTPGPRHNIDKELRALPARRGVSL